VSVRPLSAAPAASSRTHRRLDPRTALFLLLAVAWGAASAEVRLEIEGVEDELEENVRLSLGELPDGERPRALERYVDNVPELAARALAALGYYAADIDVDRRQEGEDTVVAIDVVPNDPVRVNRLNLRIEGPARLDPEYMPVVGTIPMRKGAVFLSADYEGIKGALVGRAQDLGYFDFQFTETEVRVSRRRLTADVTLVAESGPRYTFGRIVFDTDALSDDFLRRWLPFEPGDPY